MLEMLNIYVDSFVLRMHMPGGGHEQEEEVEVSVGEEAALVDLVEETLGGAGDHVLRGHPVSVQVILGNLHTENILWRIKNI